MRRILPFACLLFLAFIGSIELASPVASANECPTADLATYSSLGSCTIGNLVTLSNIQVGLTGSTSSGQVPLPVSAVPNQVSPDTENPSNPGLTVVFPGRVGVPITIGGVTFTDLSATLNFAATGIGGRVVEDFGAAIQGAEATGTGTVNESVNLTSGELFLNEFGLNATNPSREVTFQPVSSLDLFLGPAMNAGSSGSASISGASFNLSIVPEPTTLTLMAPALLGLGWFHRWKRVTRGLGRDANRRHRPSTIFKADLGSPRFHWRLIAGPSLSPAEFLPRIQANHPFEGRRRRSSTEWPAAYRVESKDVLLRWRGESVGAADVAMQGEGETVTLPRVSPPMPRHDEQSPRVQTQSYLVTLIRRIKHATSPADALRAAEIGGGELVDFEVSEE